MRKISEKRRLRDVRIALEHRSQRQPHGRNSNKSNKSVKSINYRPINAYIDKAIRDGLLYERVQKGIVIKLPTIMDFDENYENTVLHLNSISKLVDLIRKKRGSTLPKKAYNLVSVNFDNLKLISTPAALVLTAEISNWEDAIRNKLKPDVTNWNKGIYSQFDDIGFFDLFDNKPKSPPDCSDASCSDKKLVKYIKGLCGDAGKTRELKDSIAQIVGEGIKKWTFLHSGLDEAITNVFHHAYPSCKTRRSVIESWYLTGSYNESTKELKVVFYDQGVGIPKTLPTSKWKEQVLASVSKFPGVDKKKDEALLKAAMEIGRTRTGEDDRGKGLHDLLTFIKERESGRISVLSCKGHYKFIVENGIEDVETSCSNRPILGTLIIWSVIL